MARVVTTVGGNNSMSLCIRPFISFINFIHIFLFDFPKFLYHIQSMPVRKSSVHIIFIPRLWIRSMSLDCSSVKIPCQILVPYSRIDLIAER